VKITAILLEITVAAPFACLYANLSITSTAKLFSPRLRLFMWLYFFVSFLKPVSPRSIWGISGSPGAEPLEPQDAV
jgi:hypothetical protein